MNTYIHSKCIQGSEQKDLDAIALTLLIIFVYLLLLSGCVYTCGPMYAEGMCGGGQRTTSRSQFSASSMLV